MEPIEPVLTLQEMEERYPNEWVLIAEAELDEAQEVVRGRVVAHAKNREEFDRKSAGIDLPFAAYRCFKPFPEHFAFKV